jgi:hypothetical protein
VLPCRAFASSASGVGDDKLAATDSDKETDTPTATSSSSPTTVTLDAPLPSGDGLPTTDEMEPNPLPSSYDPDTANVRASLLPEDFVETEEDLSLVYHRTKHFARPRRDRVVGGRSASPPQVSSSRQASRFSDAVTLDNP